MTITTGPDRHERLAAVLTDVIVEADLDGVVTYVSPSCRTLLGFEPEEIVGLPALEWVDARDRSRVAEEHLQVLGSTEPVTSTYRCRRKDGSLAWIESISQPLRDPDTRVLTSVLGCCRDVTERRAVEERLRASEAMLADAQAVANIGSWEWDLEADRISWSDELYRIFGLDPGGFAATYAAWLGHIHPEDRRLADETVRKALTDQEPYRFYHRVVWPSGEVRVVLGRGQPEAGPDGTVVRMVGTAQDVTEQRRARAALARVREELQRSNRELEQFAFDVSHDLNEPLQVMSNAATWLCEHSRNRTDPESAQVAASIVDGVDRLRSLISDLLEYSRVASEPPAREKVDCAGLVEQVTELLAETIAEKQARVSWGRLPVIEAHPTQLARVFQNLISNALKFTAAGTTPRVLIEASRDDDGWRFSVTDNGIGIDPGQRDQAFEMFRRLSASDLYAGTGIGLSLCRRIVEHHGGRIWVDPAPDGGSVFSFTIPDAHSSSPRRIASATADARSEAPSFS